jgi:histidinol-phosphate aminotransferase
MGKINIDNLTRKNIREMHPYSSARDEFQGTASVLMDANENPFNAPYNRYPDPHQKTLKKKISGLTGVNVNSIFLGNGSDEAIDLIIRTFCEPGVHNIISIDPTYGMYEVCANINNVEFRKVLLNSDFSLNTEALLEVSDINSRIIFLCSPNNPTSNLLEYKSLLHIVNEFRGIVVIDEAYIDFSSFKGMLDEIADHNNLVILRTFSKAWGLAGIRLGMAFADNQIISVLDKIKYPYNINILTLETMMKRLSGAYNNRDWINIIISQREILRQQLSEFDFVLKIYPSDSNFLLVKIINSQEIYSYLRDRGIIVRDRSNVSLCDGCLRITVGSQAENNLLINTLKNYT